MLKKSFVLVIVLAAVGTAFSQQRLVVIGGGDRPEAALGRFVEWSGGAKSRILIITWASGVPKESAESLKEDFAKFPGAKIEFAPFAPLDGDGRAKFIEQMKTATGVFFSGGDQNRIMDVLKDEELLKLLRDRYDAGIAFAGTSAGAALMSSPMMTGENDLTVIDGTKVGTRPGLGLLPNAIVDQHFIVRRRQNRLFGLVLSNPKMLGVGIDEDTAIAVRDNRYAEVLGASYVMFVDGKRKDSTFSIFLGRAGQVFDLKRRKLR